MDYRKDWMLRQVQHALQVFASMVLGKHAASDRLEVLNADPQSDLLDQKLTALIQGSRIGEAEDLLFDSFEDSVAMRAVSVHFYEQLSDMSDEVLEQNGFSRDEILSGLRDLAERIGLPGFLITGPDQVL